MPSDLRLASLASGRLGIDWGDDNDAQWDDDLGHAVTASLVWHRGRWVFDTDGSIGSQLYKLGMLTSRTPSQAAAYVNEALDSLVRGKQLEPKPRVVVRKTTTGRLAIDLTYIPVGGSPQTRRITL